MSFAPDCSVLVTYSGIGETSDGCTASRIVRYGIFWMTRGSGRIVQEWVRIWGAQENGRGAALAKGIGQRGGPGMVQWDGTVITFNDCTLYFIRGHL